MRNFRLLILALVSLSASSNDARGQTSSTYLPPATSTSVAAPKSIEALIVWDKADIAKGIGNVSTLRVVDSKKLAAIEEFFPDFSVRGTNRVAVAWQPAYEILFTFDNGETIQVAVSARDGGSRWSTGYGEHAAKGNVAEFIDGVTRDALIGTWEYVSPSRAKRFRVLKQLTRNNFSWSHNELESKTPKASSNGTWSVAGDVYKEHVDFATEGHKHLRGKEFVYTIKIDGDKWYIKAAKGTGIVVDELWKKVD